MSKKSAKVEVIPPFMIAKKDQKTGLYTEFSGLGKAFVSSILPDARLIGEMRNKAAGTPEKLENSINLARAFAAYKQAGGKGLPTFVNKFIDSTCPDEYGTEGSTIRDTINHHSVFNGVRYMIENIAKPVLTGQTKEQKLLKVGIDPKNADKVRAYTKESRETTENAFRSSVVEAILELIEFGATQKSIDTLVKAFPGMVEKESGELKKRGKDLAAQIKSATDNFYITKAGIKFAPPSIVPQVQPTAEQNPHEVSAFATSIEQLKAAKKRAASKK